MQTIPSGIRTLLTSRAMYGTNAPTASIRLGTRAEDWDSATPEATEYLTAGPAHDETSYVCVWEGDPSLVLVSGVSVYGSLVWYWLRSYRFNAYGVTPSLTNLDGVLSSTYTGYAPDPWGRSFCDIHPSGNWVAMAAYSTNTGGIGATMKNMVSWVYAFDPTTGLFGDKTHSTYVGEDDGYLNSVAFHPSGNFIAFAQNSNPADGQSGVDMLRVHAFDATTGAIGAVTDGHANVPAATDTLSSAGAATWSPDSRFIALHCRPGGVMVLPVNPSTGEISAGTHAPAPTNLTGRGATWYPCVSWHPTGGWIAVSGEAAESQQVCVHPFDPDALTIGARIEVDDESADPDDHQTNFQVWDGDGNYLLLGYFPDEIHVSKMTVDPATSVASFTEPVEIKIPMNSPHVDLEAEQVVFPFGSDPHYILAAGERSVKIIKFGESLYARATDVTVDREQAASAQQARVMMPNVNSTDFTDPGYYSPDRGDDVPADKNDWYHVLFPGCEADIYMGYGGNLVRVFKGQVDDTVMWTVGASYQIELQLRDDAWSIIDKVVMDGSSYKLTYTAKTVEYIVTDLLTKAGIAATDITTEATGITITQKVFERLSYADALAWCQTVSGFELLCDEEGKWSFHYPTDRQPEAEDEVLVLTGTDWTNLAHDYVVSASQRVRSAAGGGGTLYSDSLDYEIELGSPARIRRRAGTTIPDGGMVYVTYVYAAWSFQEGVDIFRLPYRISRRDIYGSVVVYGKAEDDAALVGTYTYAGSTSYGVPADKVLFVELPELDTTAKCQTAADQLGHDMVTKLREVQFAAVGNPWIRVGDCVRVRESSTTISEIYRVTSLSHSLRPDGFITEFSAYHYGYTPL